MNTNSLNVEIPVALMLPSISTFTSTLISISPSNVIPPPTTTSPPTIRVFAIPTELVIPSAPSIIVLLNVDTPLAK